jgi:hypothetical protein
MAGVMSHIGFATFPLGLCAALFTIEALFAAWWDLADEPMLPLFASAA